MIKIRALRLNDAATSSRNTRLGDEFVRHSRGDEFVRARHLALARGTYSVPLTEIKKILTVDTTGTTPSQSSELFLF